MSLIVQPVSLPILYKLSQDFVMLTDRNGTRAFRVATGEPFPREALITFTAKHYGNIAMLDKVTNQMVNKNSGAVFWEWDDASRRVVGKVVFEPTSEPEDLGGEVLNTWYVRKLEMAVPNPNAQFADIQPLINHLMFISDEDKEGVLYFLNWLAWLWRYPDTKIPTAIMFYSKNTRMGKSMLADLLAFVFGENMVKSIAGSKLYANFDDAMNEQRLIVLNELSRADRADRFEAFKSMISEENTEFEGKGKASRYQRNYTHWIITTNNADCLPLIADNGRVLVLRCEAGRRDEAYYTEFARWMEDEGPEALAGCFAKWDFKGWNPKAPVPQTAATVLTQKESGSDLAKFLRELISAGKPPFDKDLGRCTGLVEQLNTLYPGNVRSLRLTTRSVPTALQECGAKKLESGTADYAWCWRNFEQWNAAGVTAWKQHLDGTGPGLKAVASSTEAADRRVQP